MPSRPQIAVIGAGIGGLALAGLLSRRGGNVTVYEQARAFERIGAGIQMSPNAMQVLRALDLEPQLRRLGFAPPAWSHRVWDSGEHLSDLTFGAEAEHRYGAPYLLLHRGDLHAAILSAVPTAAVRFDKKLIGIDRGPTGVNLRFADGSRVIADAVVGADGVHSRVRETLLGPERPTFTGRVAHRTVFPPAALPETPCGGQRGRCFRQRCWRALPSVPAPSGGGRTGISSSIRSIRGAMRSTSSPACPIPTGTLSHGRNGATWPKCTG